MGHDSAIRPTRGRNCQVKSAGTVVPKIQKPFRLYSLRDFELNIDMIMRRYSAMYVAQHAPFVSGGFDNDVGKMKKITCFDVGVYRELHRAGPIVGAKIVALTDVDDLGFIGKTRKLKDVV